MHGKSPIAIPLACYAKFITAANNHKNLIKGEKHVYRKRYLYLGWNNSDMWRSRYLYILYKLSIRAQINKKKPGNISQNMRQAIPIKGIE